MGGKQLSFKWVPIPLRCSNVYGIVNSDHGKGG